MKIYWESPDVVTLYGSRPSSNPDLWFLSPWEFTQYWEPIQLKPPSRSYSLTEWASNADRKRAQPGFDFFLKESMLRERSLGSVFPKQKKSWRRVREAATRTVFAEKKTPDGTLP